MKTLYILGEISILIMSRRRTRKRDPIWNAPRPPKIQIIHPRSNFHKERGGVKLGERYFLRGKHMRVRI